MALPAGGDELEFIQTRLAQIAVVLCISMKWAVNTDDSSFRLNG